MTPQLAQAIARDIARGRVRAERREWEEQDDDVLRAILRDLAPTGDGLRGCKEGRDGRNPSVEMKR